MKDVISKLSKSDKPLLRLVSGRQTFREQKVLGECIEQSHEAYKTAYQRYQLILGPVVLFGRLEGQGVQGGALGGWGSEAPRIALEIWGIFDALIAILGADKCQINMKQSNHKSTRKYINLHRQSKIQL